MNRKRHPVPTAGAGGGPRLDVLKTFTATQMLAVHAARRAKRQKLESATNKRMLRNVQNLIRLQKSGMAGRREAFVECIANMGAHVIDVLSQATDLQESLASGSPTPPPGPTPVSAITPVVTGTLRRPTKTASSQQQQLQQQQLQHHNNVVNLSVGERIKPAALTSGMGFANTTVNLVVQGVSRHNHNSSSNNDNHSSSSSSSNGYSNNKTNDNHSQRTTSNSSRRKINGYSGGNNTRDDHAQASAFSQFQTVRAGRERDGHVDERVIARCSPSPSPEMATIILDEIADATFFDMFRLTRETFQHIYEDLSPFLEGDADTVQQNLAIALWVLGGSEALYGPLTLIPEEQRIECTLDFCRCVTKCLMPKVISMHDRMDSTMWNFQCKFGLRNCAGALNFTHIPVHLNDSHKDDSCEYVNQAGFRSIMMQAVVSSDYRFCDLSIGYPGRTPVDRVLYNSALWRKCEAGILFPASSGGPNQGPHPYLIAGTCYPLSERIVTPFQAPKFSDIEKRFNNSIYNALSVTQKAFKLLRSRFPLLLDLSGVAVEDAPCIAAACCALHNVCEARGEITRSAWEAKATARQHQHLTMAQGQAALDHEPDSEALLFREMVKNSMIHSYDRKF